MPAPPPSECNVPREASSFVWHPVGAIALAVKIEAIAPAHGFHVALTGGCLYGKMVSTGTEVPRPDPNVMRKDADFVVYRIRDQPNADLNQLFAALEAQLGLTVLSRHGFVTKATYYGKPVDLLFPEYPNYADAGYEG